MCETPGQGEPFEITICVLGAARRKQLHHRCNKCHLQSSSSVPDGQRRMKILSEWRFAPDKPMAPSVGDGAIDFLVARTKDGSAEMLCGKVTAHVIVGGTAHWTLRYHGGLEKTVTIDTLNRRLQDRYVLLVQLSERGTAHDGNKPWTCSLPELMAIGRRAYGQNSATMHCTSCTTVSHEDVHVER